MERKFVPVPSGVEKMGYEKSAKVMQGSSKLKRPVSGIVNFNRAVRDAIWLIFGALFSYERSGTKLRAAAGCGTSSTHLDSLPRSFVRSFVRSLAPSLRSAISQAVSLWGAIPLVCQDKGGRGGRDSGGGGGDDDDGEVRKGKYGTSHRGGGTDVRSRFWDG